MHHPPTTTRTAMSHPFSGSHPIPIPPGLPPFPTPNMLNPALIKKQRIDNKECEVIDLCDEDNLSLPTTTSSNPFKLNTMKLNDINSSSDSSLSTPTNIHSLDEEEENEHIPN